MISMSIGNLFEKKLLQCLLVQLQFKFNFMLMAILLAQICSVQVPLPQVKSVVDLLFSLL